MKKYFLSLSVLFVALFLGVVNANAGIAVPMTRQCQVSDPIDGEANASCDIYLEISGTSVIKTGDVFEVNVNTPTHVLNNTVTLTAETGWEIVDRSSTGEYNIENGAKVTFKYTGTDEINATTAEVKIGVGTYVKDDAYAENCGFSYGLVAPACSIQPSKENPQYYYGIDGRNVDEDTYYKECFSCKVEDGHYYGLSGKEVDEATYNKECTNICKIENGKYYCKDGNECTKEDYDNECPKNTNTGAFLPVAGIVAGIALIGVSTIMVRRQTKLRRL